MNRSALVIVFSFAGAILAGTLLLTLPVATVAGVDMTLVDALFMATSATCVTGLVVHDIGQQYTRFGQTVIMILIQIGGLGIITLSTFLITAIAGKMSIGSRQIMQDALFQLPVSDMRGILRKILIWVFVIEGIGVVLIYLCMGEDRSLYHAVFHAVSAFCNAGFSLYGDASLTRFQGNLPYNAVMAALIVLGGLGFLVLSEIWSKRKNFRQERFTVHTQLTVVTTAILMVFGAVTFTIFEARNILEHYPPIAKLSIVLFQTVTPRTAGFNSIDFSSLTEGTLAIMLFQMVIGGSPCSAAGGIKTTTLAICAIYLWSRMVGDRHPSVFNRTIPQDTLQRAFALLATYVCLLGCVTVSLLILQYGTLPHTDSHGHFLEVLFEAVSALSTVGLSLGLTAKLNMAGKIVIIMAMFVGRIGALTFATIVLGKDPGPDFKYAEEQVLIG